LCPIFCKLLLIERTSFTNRLVLSVAALAAFVSLLAGCGGGGGDESALSKAQFIKQADTLCKKMDTRLYAKLQRIGRLYPEGGSQQVVLEKFLLGVILPEIQQEARELGDLPAPKGDEENIQAITSKIEAGIENAEDDPTSTVTDLRGPFSAAIKSATEYGFEVCNEPT
jgi:hypothetical protein